MKLFTNADVTGFASILPLGSLLKPGSLNCVWRLSRFSLAYASEPPLRFLLVMVAAAAAVAVAIGHMRFTILQLRGMTL